jgi:hypothetical protein
MTASNTITLHPVTKENASLTIPNVLRLIKDLADFERVRPLPSCPS